MPITPVFTDDQFREAVKTGEQPAEVQLRKGFVTEVKTEDSDNRILNFTISTGAVDRMGDTINVDGWRLANYRKNPVILWSHDASMMPIGKSLSVDVEDGRLRAKAQFVPKDISPFADSVYRALQAGFLSATSVGFAPIKYAFSDAPGRQFGLDFIEQELLEFSVVSVPANQEALIEGKSAGLALACGSPLRGWVDELARAAGFCMMPQKQIDAIMGLPGKLRSFASSMPDKAKGHKGQVVRCANIAERTIKSEAELSMTDEDMMIILDDEDNQMIQAQDEKKVVHITNEQLSLQRKELARRRLELFRHRIA